MDVSMQKLFSDAKRLFSDTESVDDYQSAI